MSTLGPEAVNSLFHWSNTRGVWCSTLRAETRAGRGLCLVAAQNCDEGAAILFVPACALIVEDAGDGVATCIGSLSQGLARTLLQQAQKGQLSSFSTYIDFLFEGEVDVECPEDWELLPGFAGSFAQGRFELRRRDIMELCRRVPGTTPSMAAKALHIVESRSFFSPTGRTRALVPICDLANHEPWPSAHWSMDSERNLSLIAIRPLASGDEVSIRYCGISNLRLLLVYGFVLAGPGPHRSVELEVRLPGSRAEVDVRVLGDGSLRRRLRLTPLLQACCSRGERRARQAELARALQACAEAERDLWQARSRAGDDSRLELLSTMSAEVLERFVRRISTWLEGSRAGTLFSSLRPSRDMLQDESSQSSEDPMETEDDDSEKSEGICGGLGNVDP